VTISCDDVDALIHRLFLPLPPPARDAFRVAALEAVTHVPCLGEGAIYRAVACLQRQFWDPPPDLRVMGARHHRESKLIAAEAIGADDPRVGGRDRSRMRATG